MKFIILTLFPESFKSYFDISIIKRAVAKKFIKIEIKNLRDWTEDAHKTVDDRPYGGGVGMVLRVDIMAGALRAIKAKNKTAKVILLTPQGKPFNQKLAQKLSKDKTLILICGRYEGFDERIRKMVDLEISIGDYVLTGGEIPAMTVVDAIARLVPGVVGKHESVVNESFSENLPAGQAGLLEYPQYTRPEVFSAKGGFASGGNVMKVPKVLLSGDHKKINDWRKKEALKRTKSRRPDLLK